MVAVELDCRDPQRHLLGVQLTVMPQRARLRLQLPAWTPGSYLIRDYVRQLEALQVVQAGTSLPLRRSTPARWELDCNPEIGRAHV